LKAYLKEFRELRPYYIPLPFIIIISYLLYHFLPPKTAIFLGKEDHFFEWLTAICFLGSCIYFFLSFKKSRNFFFLLLALVMLFGAGEEISWGQRIFGYGTPETVKDLNVQGEFNLHNLEIFNQRQFTNQRRDGLKRLLEMGMMFKIFTFAYGILLPLATWHIKSIQNLVQQIRVPVPPVSIGVFFFFAWWGRAIVVKLLKIPSTGEDPHEYWGLLGAASEYYEFLSSAVVLSISLYFYKTKLNDIIGKDVKQVLTA
jgi:hypothetical protein